MRFVTFHFCYQFNAKNKTGQIHARKMNGPNDGRTDTVSD